MDKLPPVFDRVPPHLQSAFEPLPKIESGGVIASHARQLRLTPAEYRSKYPELGRRQISVAEAKARLESRRPPPHVQVWIDDMLTRNGDDRDRVIMIWDYQVPRWSFWVKTRDNEHYRRNWIVGDLEAEDRGVARDFDETGFFQNETKQHGPYRLPTKYEIDYVVGVVQKMKPSELDAYLTKQQEEDEAELERQFEDFDMDYFDYRNLIDAWIANDGIRTWCCQAGWTSDAEKNRKYLERNGWVVIDRGTHTVRVKKNSRMHLKILDEMREEAEAEKPYAIRKTQELARKAALGQVSKAVRRM